MEATTTLAIIQSILTYGPKAIITIATVLETKDNPTVEEIKALFIGKDPEEYFK